MNIEFWNATISDRHWQQPTGAQAIIASTKLEIPRPSWEGVKNDRCALAGLELGSQPNRGYRREMGGATR
jgi:hypothetical protein